MPWQKTKLPWDSVDSEKTPITSTEIWTLVHLTENWFSYQVVAISSQVTTFVCGTQPLQWKALMSCFMPVLSFIEGHFQRISLLSLLSLAVWILMDASLHHKFIQLPHLALKHHAPPQSSQCPYGQRLDMQPSQTLEATVAAKPGTVAVKMLIL